MVWECTPLTSRVWDSQLGCWGMEVWVKGLGVDGAVFGDKDVDFRSEGVGFRVWG
jgi:hypothetical protein